jgi:hypothetical protein
MRRMIFTLPLVAGLVFSGISRAGIDADPNKDYPVIPQAGPWMVCATCYVGPLAPQLAREMVYEIRSHFGVPAYVWNKGEEEKMKERERLRKLHEQYGDAAGMVRLPTISIKEECAVLVGGYKDQEAAIKALRDVKSWPAPQNKALCPVIHKVAYQDDNRLDQKPELEGSYLNPYVMAFVSHNPTVSMEKKADPKLEALMKKINAHEKYSVYGCRKPWTLVVAQFQGISVIQTQAANESFIEKVFGTWKGESLSAGALNAENMCEAMRKGKPSLDAYVLHTTWGSVVCVGGFDSLDDPKMKEMKNRLMSMPRHQGATLMQEPVPMEVPKS